MGVGVGVGLGVGMLVAVAVGSAVGESGAATTVLEGEVGLLGFAGSVVGLVVGLTVASLVLPMLGLESVCLEGLVGASVPDWVVGLGSSATGASSTTSGDVETALAVGVAFGESVWGSLADPPQAITSTTIPIRRIETNLFIALLFISIFT